MTFPISSKKPILTVYITNHNYGNFLEQCIQSILAQTFKDYELLIIDDGSEDHSKDIITKYEAERKVQAIFQRRKGLPVSNNIALKLARGNYIMRLDADDYLDENALSIMIGTIERYPQADMVFSDYYLVDSEGNVTDVVRRHNFDNVRLLDQPAHGACTVIRKSSLKAVGGYDESFKCQDGFDLWLRFTKQYKVRNVNLPLFYYRKHTNSLTQDEGQVLRTRHQILEKYAVCHENPLSVTAIIPVRGGHLDPDSIAMKKLGNKPLISYTVDNAIRSKQISHVCVTTPNEEIIEYVKNTYGDSVIAIQRDARLARLNTPIVDTVFHTLSQLKEKQINMDAFSILYVESPFRTSEDIDAAINVMKIFDTDIVVGVRPDDGQFYQHNGCGLVPIRKNQLLRLEREDIFREATQMRIVKREFFENQKQIHHGKMGHLVVDQLSALKIKTEWDWMFAEMVVSQLFENKKGFACGRS